MKITFSDAEYDAMIARLFVRYPSFGAVGAGAYKPGLERVLEMCHRMGDPQKRFRCIHVAGTNGKGSTCNMLAAHFACSGLRTGLYTSPHILDFRERMRVVEKGESAGVGKVTLIPRLKVWEFIEKYRPDLDELNLSFFEITTAMAFDFFASSDVDIAVIETGLGGRLDATNVITPDLSVITNIGYDHMDLLGPTLADIAAEKAGIIKPGVPVVIGESGPETDPVFLRVASENNSPIVFADWPISAMGTVPPEPDCAAIGPSQASLGPSPSVWPGVASGFTESILMLSARAEGLKPAVARVPDGTVPLLEMDLKGIYQAKNVNTVLCALKTLGQKPDMTAISNAAHICDFHGRWEQICDNPVTICDIGHNEHGLKYNFKQLNDLLDAGTYTDLVMVYGSVKDKDVDAVLRILPERAHIFFTAAANHRAMPAEELMQRSGHAKSEIASDVADAAVKALSLCATMARPLLYIGGSTYVVSEAVPIIKRHNQ